MTYSPKSCIVFEKPVLYISNPHGYWDCGLLYRVYRKILSQLYIHIKNTHVKTPYYYNDEYAEKIILCPVIIFSIHSIHIKEKPYKIKDFAV